MGIDDHFHREFMPRDKKSHRKGWFSPEQTKSAVVQLEIMTPVSFRLSLNKILPAANQSDHGICCRPTWGLHEAGETREKQCLVDETGPHKATPSCLLPYEWQGAACAPSRFCRLISLLWQAKFRLEVITGGCVTPFFMCKKGGLTAGAQIRDFVAIIAFYEVPMALSSRNRLFTSSHSIAHASHRTVGQTLSHAIIHP